MPGTYLTPRAYNRRWWIDVSTNGTPEWAEIAKGISSRGNSISGQGQDYYDNMGAEAVNGHQGVAVLSITDDGSGDANNRENIGFGLKIEGTPEAGVVTIAEGGTPTFTPAAAKAGAK